MNKKLLAYSAMACALVQIKNTANAEAVYTNIDPDTIINDHLEYYYLDINNDAISDFQFFNVSYIHYDTFYNTSEFRQKIWAGVMTWDNGVAGSSQTFVGGGTRYYPYALHLDAPINDFLQFNNWINQEMVFRTSSSFTFLGNPYYITNLGGNWYPEFIDHFVGVKFLDMDNKNHFGWIRCDVLEEGRILVIKDYAYESKPNVSIKAGDMLGDTTSRAVKEEPIFNVTVDQNILEGLTIYTFNSDLFVNLEEVNHVYELKIYSITGQIMHTQTIAELNTIIPLNSYNKGYYLIEVTNEEGRFTKKVFVN